MFITAAHRVSAAAAAVVLGSGLLSAGPAVAGEPSGAQATVSASTEAEAPEVRRTAADTHSVGHPNTAADYADGLIRAWVSGTTGDLEKRARPKVVRALTAQGDAHVKQWKRVAADADETTATAVYANRTTGRLLTLEVDRHAAAKNAERAVHTARFTR